MKGAASLRFAGLTPGKVSGEEALDSLCLFVSHRALSEISESQEKQTGDSEKVYEKAAD